MIESMLLPAIQDDLFNEEGLAIFEEEVRSLWSESKRTKAHSVNEAQRRLETVNKEITNILTAIKVGILTPTTKQALEASEAERAKLLEAIPATG